MKIRGLYNFLDYSLCTKEVLIPRISSNIPSFSLLSKKIRSHKDPIGC
jgi:hypothetical protein